MKRKDPEDPNGRAVPDSTSAGERPSAKPRDPDPLLIALVEALARAQAREHHREHQ